MKKNKRLWVLALVCLFAFLLLPDGVWAEGNADPSFLGLDLSGANEWTSAVKLFAIVTLLAFAPALFIMLTCFPYVVIVLGLTKQALGAQNVPPSQVVIGLALFITLALMSPVIHEIQTEAYTPYQNHKITMKEALVRAEKPIKNFMLANTYDGDLKVMFQINHEKPPKQKKEVSFLQLVPAFQLTQITKGLFVGAMICAGFVIIDMIVGAVLMFLGMIMLPPQLISLPLKLLVFVFIGGFTDIVTLMSQTVHVS